MGEFFGCESDTSRLALYTNGIDLFVEWCATIPSAIPVEFGTIGCPGLSDIDIGVVFKDTSDFDNYNLCQHLRYFPEKTKALMGGGTLMFFPEIIFKDILLIDDICVKFLTDTVDIKENTDVKKHLVDLIQIIEWFPERIVATYLEFKKLDVDIKRLVGLFYSTCYSLKKIQMYAGINKKINNFIEQVYNFRKMWFSLKTNVAVKMLKDISGLYMDVCSEAINIITPILINYFKVFSLDKLQYNIYKNVYFNAIHDKDIYIDEYNDNVYVNIPVVFLCTYFTYSKYNSYLGSVIARRIKDKNFDIMISKQISDILQRRAHICSSLFDFVKGLGCGTGLYKFGWYLNE